jgi:hypothetical protein
MSPKATQAVEQYIEAVVALRALEQAKKDEPAIDRSAALLTARAEVARLRGKLRGSQLTLATQRITAQGLGAQRR